MKVVIDSKSGFCVGVVKAIEKAEAELASGVKVLSLGDIMHNKVEMQRLEKLGLKSIKLSQVPDYTKDIVLIRAHGEPPSTYKRFDELGMRYIDATCSVVANLQRQVKRAYEEMSVIGGQVVILGKHGHPEVVGLTGQVDERVIVIDSLDELITSVDFSRPIYLLSQTTKSLELFNLIVEEIKARYKDSPQGYVTIKDTICRQVSNRYPHLAMFSTEYDIIIFVSGAESSNGKVLFEVCKKHNTNSYKIEDESQIDASWFAGCSSVGVCGATSTPLWLMERVANHIKTINR